jgi:hypothetical protein
MTKLEKIEQDIVTLSSTGRRKLADWLAEYQEDEWDRQIEADAKAGRLDRLIAEAKDEVKAGKVRPL